MRKYIKNQTFDGMEIFSKGDIIDCDFENVIFTNCKFSQRIENCTFKNCQFVNSKMYDTLFIWNTLIDCHINNLLIINNSSVRENKFINTKINNFNIIAVGLCYNEYIDCIFDDISDLIVLRRDNNFEGIVLSLTNNIYNNCIIDFSSIINLAHSNLGSLMMGGSRTKPKKDYPLNKYIDNNNCEVIWDVTTLNYEQRIYYIVALLMFIANVYVNLHTNLKECDVNLRFIRTENSDEIKFIMGDKCLDTTLIEPITSIVNKCSQMPVQLMQDVPNILEEKYWKPLQKECLKTIKKHK